MFHEINRPKRPLSVVFLGGSGWHRGGGGYDFPRGRACSPVGPSGTQWDPGVAESMSRWIFPGNR